MGQKLRNLSGVYVRWKNPETKTYESRCIEEIPLDDVDKLLQYQYKEYVITLVKLLCETILDIGEKFNLERKNDNDKTEEISL